MSNNVCKIALLTMPLDAIQCINFSRTLNEINNIIKSNEEYQKSTKKMHIKQQLITFTELRPSTA